MMCRVYHRDSVDRSIDRPRLPFSFAFSRRPPSTDTNTKQHVANSLNALARLREGRRRGQQNAATSKGGKGGVKGDDEKALAAAVERFRDRCAVCTCVHRMSHICNYLCYIQNQTHFGPAIHPIPLHP